MRIKRVLLVAGASDTGKSTQLRSMFRDLRLGTNGEIPTARRLKTTIPLSPTDKMYLRLTSPHESEESLCEFLEKIDKAINDLYCWHVASAVQIEATTLTPSLIDIVSALDEQYSPELIRIVILSPDWRGNELGGASELIETLQEIPSCEASCIDATSRDRNGLDLAGTF